MHGNISILLFIVHLQWYSDGFQYRWCSTSADKQAGYCQAVSHSQKCPGKWSINVCPGIPNPNTNNTLLDLTNSFFDPAFTFRCSSLQNCKGCVTYSECAWCPNEQDGSCQDAAQVGTACQYICPSNSPLNKFPPIAIAAISVGSFILLTIGGVAWHRLYWKKRHYYERLQ